MQTPESHDELSLHSSSFEHSGAILHDFPFPSYPLLHLQIDFPTSSSYSHDA